MDSETRAKTVIRTSFVGILGNILLASFKVLAGVLSKSLAITMDALNNFSDAASSLVTIIGMKMATKPADKKHPFGYGRIEYLSAMFIGMIVFYAGASAMVESVKGIIHPETAEYSPLVLSIVAVAVLVKVLLGRFFVKQGKLTNSESLTNSGKDALFDSIISAATLVAAGVWILFGLSVESYLAAVISFFIMKAGVEMIRETVSKILGESGNVELGSEIRKTVLEFDGVEGAYDLVLNNYGPDAYIGSIHIAVPDTWTAWDIDDLIRDIQIKVNEKYNVILNAIGVYSINTKDKEVYAIQDKITHCVSKVDHVKQIHGFHVNKKTKVIRFDVVVSFDAGDRNAVYQRILEYMKKEFPDYTFQIVVDTDYFES